MRKMSAIRATIKRIIMLGGLEDGEFSTADITEMLPVAHSIVEFQLRPDWKIMYQPEELENIEHILTDAECYLTLSKLYAIKAERQLSEDDEDTFAIGSISISPGGAQQRIFNKDYQYLADRYESKAQALINMVLPTDTRLLFRITNKKGK